jgi:hypothetical protein
LIINASNMTQYADNLSEGVMAMMTKYGYSIKVYPTHRTACAPQWVYDNIAKNCVTAQLEAGGGRLGFNNAYGGTPFPIPDTSDPLAAGAEIIWNHETRWQGEAIQYSSTGWVVSGGSPILSNAVPNFWRYPYYDKNGSLATFKGFINQEFDPLTGPPNLVGEEVIEWLHTDPYKYPDQIWELLNGQARVRRAPELNFDTPSSFADGLANYDEYYGFVDSLEKYDWKFLEKKEVYIPYNNNGLFLPPVDQVFLPHFVNPDLVRWEKHRVWVVEATLHPGERNVLARRRFYVDEDRWAIALTDAWDADNALYHVQTTFNIVRPDLPGTVLFGPVVYNLQKNQYVALAGPWNSKADPTLKFPSSLPDSMFDPENMAASAQY